MSTRPREGTRRRRGLLALLGAVLGFGVLLMHTQLLDTLPAGSPAGVTSVGMGHAAAPFTADSMFSARGSATRDPVAAGTEMAEPPIGLPGRPPMPSMPSMPGMHTGGVCVAVLGAAAGLLLLVGLLLAAADPAGVSRWLAALTCRSWLSRAATHRAPWRQALTPTELCLLRT